MPFIGDCMACVLAQLTAQPLPSAFSTMASTCLRPQSKDERKTASNLAVLLPITSRGRTGDSVVSGLKRVAASFNTQQQPQAADSHQGVASPSSQDIKGSGLCSSITVLVGIDEDDSTLLRHQEDILDLFCDIQVTAKILRFSVADRDVWGPGSVCHLWSLLAKAAVEDGCNLAVLLGDDTEVQPAGWPELVVSRFQRVPQLMVLLLRDAADPGFPSFPVLRVDKHLQLFGELLPSCFVNQGGDPYLAALYRRWQGAVAMMPDVTVINHIGGVQRPDKPYQQPRYHRATINKQHMLAELQLGTCTLESKVSAPQLVRPAVDCEPAGSATVGLDAAVGAEQGRHHKMSLDCDNTAAAPATASGARHPCEVAKDTACLTLLSSEDNNNNIIISSSEVSPPACCSTAVGSIDSSILRRAMPQHSRGRGKGKGMPLWQRLLAVDVLVPTARVDQQLLEGIVDAVLAQPSPPGVDLGLILVVDRPCYKLSPAQTEWLQQLQDKWLHRVRVRFNTSNLGASATRNKALQALGFAGPSYIPKDPSSQWCCAAHQADVLFFWDAASDWQIAEVMPWAVTANVALVNTPALFDLKFPKTGGGEDIDYCLKVTGGRLVPVPQASVHHPLWNGGRRCYSRFFGWAYGDGALIPMYPQLCYSAAPSSAEACCCLLLLSGIAAAAALLLSAALQCANVALPATDSSRLSIERLPAEHAHSTRPESSSAGLLGITSSTGYVLHAAAAAAVQHDGVCGRAPTWLSAAAAAVATARRVSLALLISVFVYKLVDMLLDILRAFTPERMAKHPCNSRWLRGTAAAEASLIKTWSECGRLWGLVCRAEVLQGTLEGLAGLAACVLR